MGLLFCFDTGRAVDGRNIVVQSAKYGRNDEPMWVSIVLCFDIMEEVWIVNVAKWKDHISWLCWNSSC